MSQMTNMTSNVSQTQWREREKLDSYSSPQINPSRCHPHLTIRQAFDGITSVDRGVFS
jgi:hypothetical protein